MAEIVLDGVTKVFDDGYEAVKDLNLDIADGEFMILVGPSGCGKSTALRMIAGLEEISDGTIEIGDRVVNDVPPKDRDIAMVFQSYALYPHMTVRQNLEFGLKIRKTPKEEMNRLVNEAAQTLGITEFLDRKPKQLSGGQRQRVAIARALAPRPSVIVLDEAVSALDVTIQAQILDLLVALQKSTGMSYLFISHDLGVISHLSDRVLVMKDGKVVEEGIPDEIFQRPQHPYTRELISSIPSFDPASFAA